MADGQAVDVVLAFDLPVNLAKIGTGYLQENPIAGFFISLLAFFVLLAVIAVPISALFDIQIFPGLLPHARSFGSDLDIPSMVSTLTNSKAVEDFMNEPIDEFIHRTLGDRQKREVTTVGSALGSVGNALQPVVTILDYDNAFVAVQVPTMACRERLMCYVHNQVAKLPNFLIQAYSFVGPQMQHEADYHNAILTGLSGGDCEEIFSECPYDVLQMASFVPFLQSKGKGPTTNEL